MIDDDKVDFGDDGLPEGRNIDDSKFTRLGATLQSAAYNHPTVPVTVMSALYAFRWAVAAAGNSLHRDVVDQRQINQLKSLGTQGYIPADETQVGGMPSWTGPPAPTDTDADGLPDVWEQSHGLDAIDPADRNLTNLSSEGYTNLEVYLNSLMDPLYGALGDFNHDGEVNAADYIVWRKPNGTPNDYNVWRASFGQITSSGISSTNVPEPFGTIRLLFGTLLAVAGRRQVAPSSL
jgi:hypothetical protein